MNDSSSCQTWSHCFSGSYRKFVTGYLPSEIFSCKWLGSQELILLINPSVRSVDHSSAKIDSTFSRDSCSSNMRAYMCLCTLLILRACWFSISVHLMKNNARRGAVIFPSPKVFFIMRGTSNTRARIKIDCNRKLQYRLTIYFSPSFKKSSDGYHSIFLYPSCGSVDIPKNATEERSILCFTALNKSLFDFLPLCFQFGSLLVFFLVEFQAHCGFLPDFLEPWLGFSGTM